MHKCGFKDYSEAEANKASETPPDKRTTAKRVAARNPQPHPAVSDSMMMLVTMRIINRNGGDYREPRSPLVITTFGGSNCGRRGNRNANTATCVLLCVCWWRTTTQHLLLLPVDKQQRQQQPTQAGAPGRQISLSKQAEPEFRPSDEGHEVRVFSISKSCKR